MLRGQISVWNLRKSEESCVKTPMTVYVIRNKKAVALNASLHIMTAEKFSDSLKILRAGL